MADKVAKKGSTVSIDYTGKLETGETFDSSKGRGVLEFEIGDGKIVKGLEDSIVGMKVGDEKKITVNPENAYGKRNESLVKEVPKSTIPKEIKLKKGLILMFKREDGYKTPATVTEIKKDIVKIDFNHPLAGKKLKFEIKLVDIK